MGRQACGNRWPPAGLVAADLMNEGPSASHIHAADRLDRLCLLRATALNTDGLEGITVWSWPIEGTARVAKASSDTGARKRQKRQVAGRSRGIQSIEIGARILRALEASSGPMPLKDIAAAAKMPASKARFYMVSFLRELLVIQDPATSHYSLGPFAIQLGLAGLRQGDMVALARGAMLSLRDNTHLSVFLSIWGNRGPVIISKFEGREQSPFAVRVGYTIPMTDSPTGHIFFAHLPSSETDAILELERSALVSRGGRVVSSAALSRTALQIRKQGYAISEGQLNAGFTAVSAPIFSAPGELAGALTLLGTSTSFKPASKLSPLVNQLLTLTRELSAQLGYKADMELR